VPRDGGGAPAGHGVWVDVLVGELVLSRQVGSMV
jgi:hypothetical protein